MPDRQVILTGLTRAANGGVVLAILWHVIFAAAFAAMAAGWRPSKRRAGLLLAAPVVSVSAVSWAYENPFNGSIFGALAVALVVLAARHGTGERVAAGGRFFRAIGTAMIAFGWAYPHFLEGNALAYLVAAPLGLIPCPTLSVVIGVTLFGDGLGDRAWSWTLAVVGMFYAVFGVARLGVWIDVALFVGSLTLMARALPAWARRAVSSIPHAKS